jgi:hypothetical protein
MRVTDSVKISIISIPALLSRRLPYPGYRTNASSARPAAVVSPRTTSPLNFHGLSQYVPGS